MTEFKYKIYNFGDSSDFQFYADYGMDFLNHVAKVLVEEGDFTAAEIREGVAEFMQTHDEVEMWSWFCEPSIRALQDYLEERKGE